MRNGHTLLYKVQCRTLKKYKLGCFEAHLMVISREVGSKVLRMHDHSLENCKYNVKNFRRFLFGMSPYVWAFKVRDFTGDLEILNWSK